MTPMSDSLIDIVKVWFQSRKQGGDEPLWDYLRRTNPWVFSHHPKGECFHEHVWTMGGLHFCKGCLMTLSGAVAAVVLQVATGWLRTLPIQWTAFVFVALLLPSVVTSLLGVSRPVKHVARVLLGVLMVSAVWLFIITEDWWVRLILVAVYFSVKLPLDRRRRRQNSEILHNHTATSHQDQRRSRSSGSAKLKHRR